MLNKEQFEALKTALTSDLTLIQGPPGTGKTFLGQHLVEVLLRNKKSTGGERQSPILIVCYTNQALDSFLEDILKVTKKVIRIGGRSASEILVHKNYWFKKLKDNHFTYFSRNLITSLISELAFNKTNFAILVFTNTKRKFIKMIR